jgi:hypothetical protein
MQALAIKHTPSGLFSECSIRLYRIIDYFNRNKKLPERICSKQQFLLYQDEPETDVAKILFLPREYIHIDYRHRIDFHYETQYSNYRQLAFKDLQPFLERYFTPMARVTDRIGGLIQRYKLNFSNIIGVIYRGNDKVTEIQLAPYELFFEKAAEVLKRHPTMRFLVQTDELEFRNEFCLRFPNSFFFETLPPIPRNPGSVIRPPVADRIGFAIEVLAAFRCLARTAHLITGSGNVDNWTVLFRGHAENVHQFLKTQFLPWDGESGPS